MQFFCPKVYDKDQQNTDSFVHSLYNMLRPIKYEVLYVFDLFTLMSYLLRPFNKGLNATLNLLFLCK
jgi:hypothetical protein